MKQEKEKGSYIFPGNEVFVLYDTYGFPKELTEEYIQDEGFQIDEAGFEKEMAAQRQRARAARQNVDSMQVQDQVLREIHVESQFTGYEQLTIQSTVAALIKDRQEVQEVNQGDEAYLFLKETPFYAESGGQVADEGIIQSENGKASVLDVQKAPNGQHLHRIKVEEGRLSNQESVKATVDQQKRKKVIKNHTATHLLHQALKDVLGDHVNQSGHLLRPVVYDSTSLISMLLRKRN